MGINHVLDVTDLLIHTVTMVKLRDCISCLTLSLPQQGQITIEQMTRHSGFVVLLSSCDVSWDILKVVKKVMEGKSEISDVARAHGSN